MTQRQQGLEDPLNHLGKRKPCLLEFESNAFYLKEQVAPKDVESTSLLNEMFS